MVVSQCCGWSAQYLDQFNWLNAHMPIGCLRLVSVHILYIYIYMYRIKVVDHFVSSILVTPHISVNFVKMVN